MAGSANRFQSRGSRSFICRLKWPVRFVCQFQNQSIPEPGIPHSQRFAGLILLVTLNFVAQLNTSRGPISFMIIYRAFFRVHFLFCTYGVSVYSSSSSTATYPLNVAVLDPTSISTAGGAHRAFTIPISCRRIPLKCTRHFYRLTGWIPR